MQQKTAFIFRGTGKRISQAEKGLYAYAVHVFWNKKAFLDLHVCLHWSENSLKDNINKNHVSSDGRSQDTLQFYDNIDRQILPSLIQLNHIYPSFYHFYPKNIIEDLDPLDAGKIVLIKYWIGIFLDQWLYEDDNIDSRERTMTAS